MGEYPAVEIKLLQEPKKIEELDGTRQPMIMVSVSLKKFTRTFGQLSYHNLVDDYFHAVSQDGFNTKWDGLWKSKTL
jgi:hypothetical protein